MYKILLYTHSISSNFYIVCMELLYKESHIYILHNFDITANTHIHIHI